MNRHLYRLIFNQRLGKLVPVSETCPAQGKGRGTSTGVVCLAALLGLVQWVPLAQANPTAPVVMNGSADFSQSGTTLTVTNSPNAIIHWGSFSIGQNELTRFVQQSSASSVLNRVVGQDPSQILGQLQSNGRVFLINPNGVIFGAGARIDTAGLIASSLQLSNEDFLAGRLKFTGSGAEGAVRNAGSITTPSGGQVLLIAPDVENSGVITSPQGEIILAAGHTVELLDTSNPALRVEISAPAGRALNLGTLVAAGGHIGLAANLVQQSGHLNASSAVAEGGRIFLKATNTASLTRDSLTEAQGSQGGEITVRSGEATLVEAGALIQANAHENGQGGRVVVWSDDSTRFHGDIEARGGSQGGDGGFAEVSGLQTLEVTGHADLSAPRGEAGEMLLDPGSITITSAPSNVTTGLLNATWVTDQLANSHLTLATTSSTLTDNGATQDIIVDAPLAWTTSHDLTLDAGRHIILNQSVTAGYGAKVHLNPGQSDSTGTSIIGTSLSIGGDWHIAHGLALNQGVMLNAGSSSLYFKGSGEQNLGVAPLATGSAGTATLNLDGGRIQGYDSDQTLILGSGLTVDGWGSINIYSSNSKIINNGILDAKVVGSTLSIDNYMGEIINNGTIKSTAGDFSISSDSFINSGSILTLAGTTTLSSAFGESWTNDGLVEVQADATFNTSNQDLINQGTIRGSGILYLGFTHSYGTAPDYTSTVNLKTLTNRGILDPGMGAGGLGLLRIWGNLVLEETGSVHIDLGGTGVGQYDQIALQGIQSGASQAAATASLGGKMELAEANNGYHAGLGTAFPHLITAEGGLTGSFTTVDQPNQDVVFDLNHTGTVSITNTSTSITRWMTAGGGDWSYADNWSRGVPTALTDAVTDQFGSSPVITISSGSHTAHSLNSDAHLILSGGNFTLPKGYELQGSLQLSGGTLVNPGDLMLSGGTLINATDLVLAGNTQWTSGTVSGRGSITLSYGASLTKSGDELLDFQQTFNNHGSVNVEEGELRLSAGGSHSNDFMVASGATLALAGLHRASGPVGFGGAGQINLSGTLELDSVAGPSWVGIDTETTFQLLDGSGISGSSELENRGTLNAGTGYLDVLLINSGTANLEGTTLAGFTNTGTLNLSGQVATTADVEFTDGTMELQDGASLALENATLYWSGGTLTGPGTLDLAKGGALEFTGDGDRVLDAPNTTLALTNAILPEGSLTLRSGGISFHMEGDGDTSIGGGSTLNLEGGSLGNYGPLIVSGTFNLYGGTYTGTGSLATRAGGTINRPNNSSTLWNNTGSLSNAGTLNLGGNTNPETISSAIANAATGTLNLGSGLTFTQTLSNRGVLNLLSGTTIFQNGLTQYSGSTHLAGGNIQGSVNLLGGNLSGSGSLSGNLTLAGLTMLSPGQSPGTIQIGGNLQLAPTSSLLIELGENQHDLLAVQGSAQLNGLLTVAEWNGYQPVEDTTFSPITAAGGLSGTFAQQVLPRDAYSTSYTSHALQVRFSTTPPEQPTTPDQLTLPETTSPFVEQFLTLAQAGLIDLIGVSVPGEATLAMDTETPRFALTAPGIGRVEITTPTEPGTDLTEVASLTELTALVTELVEQAESEEWNDESRLVCR